MAVPPARRTAYARSVSSEFPAGGWLSAFLGPRRMDEVEPARLRASDADRERVIAILTDAAGDGRLTLEEHTERMERAYAARPLGELAELTADLVRPEKRPFPPDARPAAGLSRSETRGGRWVVPTQVPVTALGGKVTMDLCDALLRSRHVVVRLAVLMGTVTLIVPEGLRIVTAPGAHITSFKNEVRPPRGAEGFPPDGPVIELAGFVFGGRVVARSPRRARKGLLGRA